MEIKKMKWLVYLMVPFVAVAISCKEDDDDDMDNGNGGNTNDGRNEVVIEEITQNNLTKIELSTTAAAAAEDSLVRLFAQSMIAEYNQAQNDLDSIAENRDIDLPPDLNNENQQLKDSLDSLSGSVLDSVYIFSQITILTEAKNMYESIADTTEDQTLLNYVNEYLPGIVANLAKADSIAFVLFGFTGGNGGNGGGNGGGNDTTDVGGDTTDVGGDTTDVGGDTTDVGGDTTDVGGDTTDVGGDTTDVGGDTTDVGGDTTDVGGDTTDVGDTTGVARLLDLKLETNEQNGALMASLTPGPLQATTAESMVVQVMEPAVVPKAEPMVDPYAVREPSSTPPQRNIT